MASKKTAINSGQSQRELNAKPVTPLDHRLQKNGKKSFPSNNSIELIGKKFTLDILSNMMLLNQNRFNQFLESIDDINSKTLSVRLREMQGDGLINKSVIYKSPRQTEYSLTEKGKELGQIIEFMAEFSLKYGPKVEFNGEKQQDFEGVLGN